MMDESPLEPGDVIVDTENDIGIILSKHFSKGNSELQAYKVYFAAVRDSHLKPGIHEMYRDMIRFLV